MIGQVAGGIVLLSALFAGTAGAADLGQPGTRFGIELSRHEVMLQYDAAQWPTTIETFNVYFTEALARDLDLGMDLGRVFMYQDGNPDSIGATPAGYQIGFWGQYQWSPLPMFGLSLRLGGRYHQALDNSDPDRQVLFEWQEYGAEFLAELRLHRLELAFGPQLQDLSGKQRNDGLLRQSWRFNADPGLQWQLQFRLPVDKGGSVAVHLEQQADDPHHRRVSLNFGVRY